MRILCLCATYGRPSLLKNAIACFEQQVHDDRYLLVLDDAGQYAENIRGDRWSIHSVPNRFPNMPTKYNAMLALASDQGLRYDAVAIWDDDDIYLPNHLAEHCRQLEQFSANEGCSRITGWSYPKTLYTLMPDLRIESAFGNHWAMCAFSKHFVERVGGWPSTQIAAWDHLFLKTMEELAPPSRSDIRSFIFRWGSTKAPHLQWFIKGPKDTGAYSRMPQHEKQFVDKLNSEFDAQTRELLKGICGIDM